MNKLLSYLMLILALSLTGNQAYSQCTPMNEETCPDPEGNGEICPDTLNPVYTGQSYHQEVSMLAPPKIDTLGYNVDLHHITLIDIAGLPDGLTWQTNAENDEFLTGTYYCILLSGTTTDPPGTYPLKIVVDIYALIFGQPVKILTVEDSTSLSLEVFDANAIGENRQSNLISKVWPNPFRGKLNLTTHETTAKEFKLVISTLLGEKVYEQNFTNITPGETISFDGSNLPEGMYFVSLEANRKRQTVLLSKIE